MTTPTQPTTPTEAIADLLAVDQAAADRAWTSVQPALRAVVLTPEEQADPMLAGRAYLMAICAALTPHQRQAAAASSIEARTAERAALLAALQRHAGRGRLGRPSDAGARWALGAIRAMPAPGTTRSGQPAPIKLPDLDPTVEREHSGMDQPMTAVEHPADGTLSPVITADTA